MEHTKESIQSHTLYRVKVENPVLGVPITFLDKYNPDQFDIVAFRKGEDGRDLIFTREQEMGSSNPCVTAIAGVIKNAEGKINGKPTYARITIRRKLNP